MHMKRENLQKAESIVRMLEHLEEVKDYIQVANENKYMGYTGVSVKFTDKLQYMFPDNVQFSMFYNILKTSVETEIENWNKLLEEC
jgi:hypothetical protein